MTNTFNSVYYQDAKDCPIVIDNHTALLVIDLQNTYLKLGTKDAASCYQSKLWQDFHEHLEKVILVNAKYLIEKFRSTNLPVIFARIATFTKDGKERSLSQKMEGWNNILLQKDETDAKIIDSIKPKDGEIEVIKSTDSALTGTNLRLLLSNMEIKTVEVIGIFTDQCVSSTVRSLSDESFKVIIPHDATAAATEQIHNFELTILNHIYSTVSDTATILAAL